VTIAPPPTFASRALTVARLPAGSRWRRMYRHHHPDPLGYALIPSRFSDPTNQAFGVVYLGASVKVCFAEAILRDRGDGRVAALPLPFSELKVWVCAEIELTDELRLIDLTGGGALRMGVPSDVAGARDQATARLWSAAFHVHPDQVDGILYPSRLNEERNVALYSRALSKVRAVATPRLLELRDELAAVIDLFDLAIV
jgi:hypothetical protein